MRLLIAIFLLFVSFQAFGQQKIRGFVKSEEGQEIIIGASVFLDNGQGTKSKLDGSFVLNTEQAASQLFCTYLGYEKFVKQIDSTKSEIVLEILLKKKANQINLVTVSGSRFQKRVQEEIVSIEVIKPKRILATGMNSMDDALNRVPGVDVIENQINIRGGAGWSYGAGSRVQVLVDDMPMLTADASDAKWNFLPLENCAQVEIIKGASSCLYGSSALNGVVNFRTAYASSKPKTKLMVYKGMYGNPRDKSWVWWGKKQPSFQGGYISHAQKIKQLDMVVGGAWYSEDSYLQGDLDRRARVNGNFRFRSKTKPGLSYGVNTNVQFNKSQTFFFWDTERTSSTTSTANYLQPYGGLEDSTTTVNKNQGQRINIDPYIEYIKEDGTKHSLRTRWFRSNNQIPEKMQSSIADLFYGEYQFQKPFLQKKGLLSNATLTTGLIGMYQNVEGELYGNHIGFNAAFYVQLEKKIDKLWLSLGARMEANRVDDYELESKPVFRLGANYELSKGTFLRTSFGQGYRYPSIAERFIRTSFGPSQVFPNPNLISETGWSAELGLKQLWKKGKWFGYFDVAAFVMEYDDMMEFNFGLYVPEDTVVSGLALFDYLGFRSNNVGRSRISGIDFSTYAQGKIGNVDMNCMLAYTYMNPISVNPDSIILANLSGDTKTLKYRYRHTFKSDVEWTYKKVSFGVVGLYNSFMTNIDEVFSNGKPDVNEFGTIFEIGTGLPYTVRKFREENSTGNFILDLRASFSFSQKIKMNFIVKNALNTIYTERPALIAPLRNFTLQLQVEL